MIAAAGLAGVAAPLVMWACLIVFSLLQPDYDVLRDPSSSLGAVGAPYAFTFNLGFFVLPGLLTLVFAGGLFQNLRSRIGKGAALGIASGGLGLILSGVLAMDPAVPVMSMLHRAMGLPFLTLVPAAILVFGLCCRARLPRGIAVLSVLVGFSLLVLVIAYQMHQDPAISDGIFQRLYLLLQTAWGIGTGSWLIRSKLGNSGQLRPTRRRGQPMSLSAPR